MSKSISTDPIFHIDRSPSWEKGDNLLIEQYSSDKCPANFEEYRAGIKSRNWYSAGESEYPNTKAGRAKAYRHARRLALGEWFSMGDKSAKIGAPTRIRHGDKIIWTGGEEFLPEA